MPPQRMKTPACLQCRSQKLKCERSAEDDLNVSPCLRCARAGRTCQTGPSSRLGRPPRPCGQWSKVWEYTAPESSEPDYSACLPGLGDWNSETAWHLDDPSPGSRATSFSSPTAVTSPTETATREHRYAPLNGSIFWATSNTGNLLKPGSVDLETWPELHADNDIDTMQLNPLLHPGVVWTRPPVGTSLKERDFGQGKTNGLRSGLGSQFDRAERATTSHNSNTQSRAPVTQGDTAECNIKILSTLLSGLCSGLEEIQSNKASPTDVAFGCLEDFACILDKINGSPSSPDNEAVVRAIYEVPENANKPGKSLSLEMPVALLILSCYVKVIYLACALFAHLLKNPPPSPGLAIPRCASSPNNSSCGCLYRHLRPQSKGIWMALLLQLVQ
ncbi:hypothetical protein F5X97DRAFT_318331 [Nemania serpens]|nr:hypothetical protein F5X97DRAFT_318331 [Nemania serpens]